MRKLFLAVLGIMLIAAPSTWAIPVTVDLVLEVENIRTRNSNPGWDHSTWTIGETVTTQFTYDMDIQPTNQYGNVIEDRHWTNDTNTRWSHYDYGITDFGADFLSHSIWDNLTPDRQGKYVSDVSENDYFGEIEYFNARSENGAYAPSGRWVYERVYWSESDRYNSVGYDFVERPSSSSGNWRDYTYRVNFDVISATRSSGTPAPEQAPVPEPGTMLLLGSGLLGIAGFRKVKKS